MNKKFNIITANQAVAEIAYKTNEVFPIYPITPASEMSELIEQWNAENKKNFADAIPSVFLMQSEAGVAGAMHGALQTGSLSATFTASQGLLLMLPNMYKIAGELTPNVIHVATRSIATHALSVFGDHSDVMAVRQSGYAMLSSASVQEAQDFALIAQAATLKSRIPFIHFFDGFRTSHEMNTIEIINDSVINKMIDSRLVLEHRNRALNPNNPVLRGTAQTSEVFFQSREAQNKFYNNCSDIVQESMRNFAALTGRAYKLFDYVGHPEAENIIISMASSTETIETTINQLNTQNEKFGLIKVRLFRPFSTKHLIQALPKSVKKIAVLDRTKEPGSTGEPLYLDIVQSISEAFQNNNINNLPRIVGGRYGLSSKTFTPSMVIAIFNNLKLEQPKQNFTIGITDDVTHLSLDVSKSIKIKNNTYQVIFYQEKSDIETESFNALLTTIGKQKRYVQGYINGNYKKSNTTNIAHLRVSQKPINAPYSIEKADFIGCSTTPTNLNIVVDNLKSKGTLLINTEQSSRSYWRSLSADIQNQIIEKQIEVFIVKLVDIKKLKLLKSALISEIHASFLALQKESPYSKTNPELRDYIYKVDTTHSFKIDTINTGYNLSFKETLLGKLSSNNGNTVPVSMLPVDGTYPTNTSQYNPIQKSEYLPIWQPDLCTQCGACSLACPQAALRIKVYEDNYLSEVPNTFNHINSEDFDLLKYTIQVNPIQCNDCSNCIDICHTKALTRKSRPDNLKSEQSNWNYFETIPEFDRTKLDNTKVSQQQLQEPLFKYSIGVEGCGEAPYLKLMSQLFGDRLLIANATGASSIFGGALPTTPWSKNKDGRGPAWSNSLFEDNAEFGLGYRLSLDQKEMQAKRLLERLTPQLNFDLVHDILSAKQITEADIHQQRSRVKAIKEDLSNLEQSIEIKQLLSILDTLVKKSVWIVGGDGWAYDIGFGGIDHVIASGKNVNILVLDNEIYDNTGGQTSKATPFGSQAKFNFNGKQIQKKDLGLMTMTYNNVYVASVAIGANQEHTLKAFNDAESFDGPSIIIAYCHSDSHGIDMNNPSQYHKAAVNSGQWLLYRNDPRHIKKGQNTLVLDSEAPTIKIEDYLKLEQRFNKLFNKNPDEMKILFNSIQKNIDNRFLKYLSMSNSNITNYKRSINN